MKRIIILSPAFPLRGGIASSTERLADVLQEKGYEVTIYSFALQYPNFLFPGKTQFVDGPGPKHLQIKTILNSINPFNWLKVGIELYRLKPDYIISRYWLPFMGPCLGTVLYLARLNGWTKNLALVDNAIPHEKRPGDQFFTKYFTMACHGFIVMSNSVEEDIRSMTTNKPIVYNPHPLYDNYGEQVEQSVAREHLGLNPGKKYILFFGFIRDYKGLDLLLQAMADDRIQSEGIQLIIAGEYYGKQDYYEQLIKDLAIQEHIIARTKFIPQDQVRYYFGAADLVVQPYKSATQSGISQIAYHFEKPMVVTNVGGLSEIVPHGQVGYVTSVDASAIADAIVQFFQSNKSAVFVQNIKQRKQIYSWEHMVQSIENVADNIN